MFPAGGSLLFTFLSVKGGGGRGVPPPSPPDIYDPPWLLGQLLGQISWVYALGNGLKHDCVSVIMSHI